jgi:hypothetical protein
MRSSGYADVTAALHNPALSALRIGRRLNLPFLINLDPPDHARMRRVVSAARGIQTKFLAFLIFSPPKTSALGSGAFVGGGASKSRISLLLRTTNVSLRQGPQVAVERPVG